MESSGYSSTYIQRSGQKRDGCGIFYKHDMYVKIDFFFQFKMHFIHVLTRMKHRYSHCHHNCCPFIQNGLKQGITENFDPLNPK